jgi:type I restriction enzyme S subunit
MELRKAYKLTEIGSIPEDWEIITLNDLVDSNRNIRYGIVQPGKYEPEGRYMVRGQDYSFGWADPYDFFRVTALVEERYKNARLKGGDLIITIVGAGTGHFEIVPDWLDGANMTQTTARIAIDKSKADSKFCKYYFQSAAGKRQISLYIKGAAQPGLNVGDVKIFKIPLPPTKAEQTAIATALSDADAYINALEKLIEKKRNIKQGAMQQLLKPKKGWVETKLTAVVEYIHGKAHEQDIVEDGPFIVVNSKFVSTEGAVAKYSNSNFCPARKNDLLTVLSDLPNGKALAKCFFVGEDNKYAVNQRVCIWRTKGSDPKFLFYVLNRNKYFLAINDGVSQTHILNHHIEKCKIFVPISVDEQKQIATILSDMDNEILSLEKKLSKSKLIKQGMMQELLTGKIRLIKKIIKWI